MCPYYLLEHLLGICPKVIWLGPQVVLCSIIWETAKLISRVLLRACNHTSNGGVFSSPHPCQHLLSPEFLILAILTAVRWNLGLFLFTFPWWLRMLNTSLGSSPLLCIPQLRILCLTLYQILIGLFISLESNILNSLYILDISPLSDIGLVMIFSQFVGCNFVLLIVF